MAEPIQHRLVVPFEKKDICKAAGARWDPDRKCWYTEQMNEELNAFRPCRLYVPYEEKDDVKSQGAIWSSEEQAWVVPSYRKTEFQKWVKNPRKYLEVPYEESKLVKAQGARWDPQKRLWYMDTKVPSVLQKYIKKI